MHIRSDGVCLRGCVSRKASIRDVGVGCLDGGGVRRKLLVDSKRAVLIASIVTTVTNPAFVLLIFNGLFAVLNAAKR